MGLVDLLSVLEDQDEEMQKQAAEEDAAGRIMARGFMDELNKLAEFGPAPLKPLQKAQEKAPPIQPGKARTVETTKYSPTVVRKSRKKVQMGPGAGTGRKPVGG